MADEIKVPAPAKSVKAPKVDLSKYAESSQRANVQANLDAGVYDRGEGDLAIDLAALPLADS